MAQNQQQLKFENEEAAAALNADVRNDATPTNWALWGYKKGSKNEIVAYGSGTGGVTELVSHLDPELIQFGLVRVSDTIDGHTTIKFVFVMWVGEKVKFFQKAQISPHKGEIQVFVGQHHTDVYAEKLDEITEEIIMTKVTDASGSGTRVLTDGHPGHRAAPIARADGGSQSRVSSTKGQEFGFEDENAAREAIASVRSGANNWAVLEFREGTSTVGVAGQGTDGIQGLTSTLTPNSVSFGLLRVEDIIDEHTTIKFVLINWVGDQVPGVRKAKLTTSKGRVVDFIGQHHNSINTSDLADLTLDEIMSKVRDASGSGNRVLAETIPSEQVTRKTVVTPSAPAAQVTPAAATNAPKVQLSGTAGAVGTVPRGAPKKAAVPQSVEGVVQFDESIKNAIAQLRKDGTGVNWVLTGYEGQSKLVLIGSGSGGLSELKSHVNADSVNYGLIRTENIVDDHVTTKFVFIIWIGENVKSIRRAKIATHKGAITEFVGQFHVDITAQTPDELTDEIVAKTVADAAGTAVHVK